jgi:polysaccharide biosynthesis transport protein
VKSEISPSVPQRLKQARKASPGYFLHALTEQGWVLVLAVLCFLLPVVLYLLLQRPVYQAGVSFQMEVTDPSSGALASPSAGWALLPQLQSPALLRDTLARSSKVEAIAEATGFNGSAADLDALSQHLSVTIDSLIDHHAGQVKLLVKTRYPDAVEDFLPELVKNFASLAAVSQRDTKLGRIKILEKNVEEAQKNSTEAQGRLDLFTEQSQVLDPDGSGKQISRMDYLQRQFKAVSEDAAQWKLDYEKIDPLRGNAEALLEIPDISEHSTIKSIKRQVAEQEKFINKLLESGLTEDSSEIVAARLRLEDIHKIMADAALQFPDLILNEYKKADFLLKQAQERVEAQKAADEKFKAEGLTLEGLRSTADAARGKYEALLRTQVDSQVAKEEGQAKPLPLEPVKLPRQQSGLTTQILLWSAFALGLLVGGIIMFVRHNNHQRIRTVHEAEQSLGVPVVGLVPIDETIHQLEPESLQQRRKDEPLMEAYRSIRAFVSVATQSDPKKIYLITSPQPGDGKTSSAIHFALAQAQSGKKTLLVDADLRRPSLSRALLKSDKLSGLADYALGIDTIENLAHQVIPNLFVLPAGRRIPNPAELLSNAWIQEFTKEALAHFDCVVFDSAPINAVGDTVLLLPHVQAVCLVVNGKNNSVQSVAQAIQTIQTGQAFLLGLILNRMPKGSVVSYGDKPQNKA